MTTKPPASGLGDNDQPQPSSLYASLYHASELQSVPVDTIMRILRIHAYETDFRRRLRSGDSCEFFFDLKDEGGTEGPPGELLFTSVSAGGEPRATTASAPPTARSTTTTPRATTRRSSSCAAPCAATTSASPRASASASTRF